MDSLNQTALMNLESKIIFGHSDLIDMALGLAIPFYIFAMPIVVLANYSNTIKGLFELAASVSGKFIFSAPSYIYPSPFKLLFIFVIVIFLFKKNRHF